MRESNEERVILVYFDRPLPMREHSQDNREVISQSNGSSCHGEQVMKWDSLTAFWATKDKWLEDWSMAYFEPLSSLTAKTNVISDKRESSLARLWRPRSPWRCMAQWHARNVPSDTWLLSGSRPLTVYIRRSRSKLTRNEVNFANDSISQGQFSKTSLRNRTLLLLSNSSTDTLPKPKTTINHMIQ